MPVLLQRFLLGFAGSIVLRLVGLGPLSYGLAFWARTKWGWNHGLVVLAGAAVFPFLLYLLPLEAFDIPFLLAELCFAWGMAVAISPWPFPDRTLYRVLAATGVTSLLLNPLWAWLTSDPAFLEGIVNVVMQGFGSSFPGGEDMNWELVRNTVLNAINALTMLYVPSVFVLFLAAIGLGQRLALRPHHWPRLYWFRVPTLWIYIFVASLLGLAWANQRNPSVPPVLWEMVLNNLGGVFILVYFLQGLGIAYSLSVRAFGRWGSLFVNLLLSGLLLLTFSQHLWQYTGLIIIGVAAFGATETWVRWRPTPQERSLDT